MALQVVHHRATVAALHALDPLATPVERPALWWCEPTDDAIVLGSRQTPAILQRGAVERAGLAVVRRRSGGGVVLIEHGAIVWVDHVLPHGIAPDDVRGAMVWAGEVWAAALAPLVPAGGGDVTVHRGGMASGSWGDLVCFAGLGPGEVLLGGAKLVGLSQRRGRHGIRIQGMLHRAPGALDAADLLAGPLPPGAPPPPAVVPADARDIVEAAAAATWRRIAPV